MPMRTRDQDAQPLNPEPGGEPDSATAKRRHHGGATADGAGALPVEEGVAGIEGDDPNGDDWR